MGIFSKFFSGSEGEDTPDPASSEPSNHSQHTVEAASEAAGRKAHELAAGTVDETPREAATGGARAAARRADPRLATPPPIAAPARPTSPARATASREVATGSAAASRGMTTSAATATRAAPTNGASAALGARAERPAPRAPVMHPGSPSLSGKPARRAKRASTGSELDGAFASLEAGDGIAIHDEEAEEAATEAARQAFREISGWYVSHVRNLMLEVKWGTLASSWLLGCERSIQSLTRFAREMRWPELADALATFSKQAASARKSGATVVGDEREALLASYQPLIELMPEAFALGHERERREPIIVRSLLLQVPEVETVEVERLMAAGMSTLESLLSASPDELAVTSGIATEVAQRIVEHIHTYKSGTAATVSAPEPAVQLRELRELTAQLEQIQQRFDEVTSSWTDGVRARKRELRNERERAMLAVNIALARLGEVDRIGEISQLPFADRIGELGAFLRRAEDQEKALSR